MRKAPPKSWWRGILGYLPITDGSGVQWESHVAVTVAVTFVDCVSFAFSAWVGLREHLQETMLFEQTKMAPKPVDSFLLNHVLKHGSAPKKGCPKSHGLACFPIWIAIYSRAYPYIPFYPDIPILCSVYIYTYIVPCWCKFPMFGQLRIQSLWLVFGFLVDQYSSYHQ